MGSISLEQVAWPSSQSETLQWSISEVVIAGTTLSAHTLLANLTSPTSIFLLCVNYTIVETNLQQDSPSVFMFSSFCFSQSAKRLRRMLNESAGSINNRVSNAGSSLHIFVCQHFE